MKTNQHELFAFVEEQSAETIRPEELSRALHEGRKLRVKLGIDVSKPDLHLGHVVPLRMLRSFQDAGHTAVLIIGDFTAMIGDPSGQSLERIPLSAVEVKKNERTYLKQIGKILDLERTEIHRNSEWHGAMKLTKFLDLLTKFSLKSAWERDDFQKRLGAGKPVYLHEAMYHVLQAYDSVAVKADVELGGLDQKLNIFAGRELQAKLGKSPQIVILLPYLIGLDGKQKMSKSLENAIHLTDSANAMFGKMMAIPDSLILNYAKLAAWLPPTSVRIIEGRLKKENPRDVKLDIAEAVVGLYHKKVGAERAREAFIRTFSKRDTTSTAVSVSLPFTHYEPLELLEALHVVRSKSEARRLVTGRALEVDGRTVTLQDRGLLIRSGTIIRVGKKSFFRAR